MTITINAIHQTDCVTALSELTAGSVDLAFADPPFNIGYAYDVYDDSRDQTSYLGWCREWIGGVHRALSPEGTFWLAIGDEYAAELKVLSQEIGFSCRSWVIWYYTFGVNCTQKFSRSHAHLFHFVKDPKNFTFNSHAIRVPSARQLVYNDKRGNPNGRLPDDTWILRPQDLAGGFTPDEDTWYFPRVAGTFKERAGFHGCQMPEQLLGRIIRSSSNAGELVLDPFSGSATTLAVAKKLGRSWLGFELSEEYARRGRARLDSIADGDDLEGAAEPLISAPATKGKGGRGQKKNGKVGRKNGTGAKSSQPATKSEPVQVKREDQEAGLIEAFRRSSEGFSVDRVVADPDLNEAFLEACREVGAVGEPFDLNRSLFRLRKAGRLTQIPTTRRTELGWLECDPYIFASEIAWCRMLEEGSRSLDDVLCSPEQARKFDEVASLFSPGFTPLEYRWAALKIRKVAKKVRNWSASAALKRLGHSCPVSEINLGKIRSAPGLYVVSTSANDVLYIGETFNLRERLHQQISDEAVLAAWKDEAEDICVGDMPLPLREKTRTDVLNRQLFGHQSRLIGKHNPKMNLRDLAVA